MGEAKEKMSWQDKLDKVFMDHALVYGLTVPFIVLFLVFPKLINHSKAFFRKTREHINYCFNDDYWIYQQDVY